MLFRSLGTSGLGRGTRCVQLGIVCALDVAKFERSMKSAACTLQVWVLSFCLWSLIAYAPKLLYLPCKTELACYQTVRFAGLCCNPLSTQIHSCLMTACKHFGVGGWFRYAAQSQALTLTATVSPSHVQRTRTRCVCFLLSVAGNACED